MPVYTRLVVWWSRFSFCDSRQSENRSCTYYCWAHAQVMLARLRARSRDDGTFVNGRLVNGHTLTLLTPPYLPHPTLKIGIKGLYQTRTFNKKVDKNGNQSQSTRLTRPLPSCALVLHNQTATYVKTIAYNRTIIDSVYKAPLIIDSIRLFTKSL